MKEIFKLQMNRFFYLVFLPCFMLLYALNLSAQTSKNTPGGNALSDIRTLEAGNPIPDAVWNMPLVLHYFNGKSKTVQLSDYKGKVIVFDFWSTTCVSCIEGIPKLELIQDKFKEDMVVLMVNSKRNKDTPKGIKARFKKYKDDFNYTPVLATVLDDTIFTKLFQHNVLPTIAVVNAKGTFVATTSASDLSDENLNKWIKGAQTDIQNSGFYKNVDKEGRGGGGSLFDTTSTYYYSVFAQKRDGFLDSYPNYIYRNGTTYLRMGNQKLSFLLMQAYPKEMRGFDVMTAYYSPEIGLDLKSRIKGNNHGENRYWYEFFSRDSVSRTAFQEIYRRDFAQYFKLAVERRKDTATFYEVSFSPEFEHVKTKYTMFIAKTGSISEEIYYQKAPIYNVLSNLSYAFEIPIFMDREERTLVDILIPAGFAYQKEQEKLDFLRKKGIILTKVRQYREYPYIFTLK